MVIMQIVPCFSVGGAERMCETLSFEIFKEGHTIIVVSLYSIKTIITDELENKGIPIIYLDKKGGLDLKCVGNLKKIIKKYKPNVIHTHLYSLKYAILATLFSKNIVVHTIHNIAQKESRKIDRIFYNFWFKNKRVVPVALSSEIKKTILQEYRIKDSSVPIIFNGIDFSSIPQKSKYECDNLFTFIHVGRFSEQKNHSMLLEAFSMLLADNPNCNLLLVGDGYLKEEMMQKTRELGIEANVSFLGLRNDIPFLMSKSDAFILPSLYEGIPMTLIEAMASGLPVIATNVGGVKEMISDKIDGLLCNINTDSIYQNMKILVCNCNVRKSLGENAYKKARNFFSSSTMASSYLSLYTKLLNEDIKNE